MAHNHNIICNSLMSGISSKARDETELPSFTRDILRAWRNCMRWRRFWSIRDLSAGNWSLRVHLDGFLNIWTNNLNETGGVQNFFVSKTNVWFVLNVCDQTGELCKKKHIYFIFCKRKSFWRGYSKYQSNLNIYFLRYIKVPLLHIFSI